MKIESIDLNWIVLFLTILLTALKLDGVINWAWLWVVSPMWILFIIVIVIVLIAIAGRHN